jgi:hypothetical protein
MRYLQSTPFAVQMGDRNAQKNYRNNYELTFGPRSDKPSKPQPRRREVVVQHAAVSAS